MATVSKTFTAVGSSGILTVKPGQSVTYSATATSLVGVVYFEKSDSGGMAWDTLELAIDASLTGGVVKNDGGSDVWFRFRVGQNGVSAVSGSVACSVADEVDVLFEYKNPAGVVVFRITDDGIETSELVAPELASLSTGVSTTTSGITSLSTGLSTTNSTVSGLSTGLSTTDSGILSLSTGLSTVDSGITSLSTGLSTTTSSVTSLSTVVGGLGGAVPYQLVCSTLNATTPDGTGWTTPTTYIATLPASQTSKTAAVAITNLKAGDVITGYRVLGRFASAGGTTSLTIDLRFQELFTGGIGSNSVGATATTSVTTDTIISGSVLEVTGLTHTVLSNANYICVLTGTTAASTAVYVTGIAIDITPA